MNAGARGPPFDMRGPVSTMHGADLLVSWPRLQRNGVLAVRTAVRPFPLDPLLSPSREARSRRMTRRGVAAALAAASLLPSAACSDVPGAGTERAGVRRPDPVVARPPPPVPAG